MGTPTVPDVIFSGQLEWAAVSEIRQFGKAGHHPCHDLIVSGLNRVSNITL